MDILLEYNIFGALNILIYGHTFGIKIFREPNILIYGIFMVILLKLQYFNLWNIHGYTFELTIFGLLNILIY